MARNENGPVSRAASRIERAIPPRTSYEPEGSRCLAAISSILRPAYSQKSVCQTNRSSDHLTCAYDSLTNAMTLCHAQTS